MTRRMTNGVAVAGGALLAALWLISISQDSPQRDIQIEIEPAPAAVNLTSLAPEERELALFQEVIKARQAAEQEAITLMPLPDSGKRGLAPSSYRKGASDRNLEAERRAAKKIADIAYAHRITLEEIEDIYRRGEALGWPLGP